MGFFQDLKEDLSQAVNELVPDVADEELDEESLLAAAEEAMGIERALDVTDMIAASEQMDKAIEEYADSDEEIEIVIPVKEATPVVPTTPVNTQAYTPVEPAVNTAAVSEEVATITRCMTVNGDVISNGSLDLIGAVNGNIQILGKLNVTGEIVGNSEAAEIYAQGANIVGNVCSTGGVKVGQNTVIRGNIYATSAVIAGAVKGDIDVHGPVILDSTAIVMGNIKSKAVQINNGAAVEGMCSQCYADVSPSNFFRE